MRGFLFAAIVAISAMLVVAPVVAADDMPAPGEVRLFWAMEPFKVPPGVPNKYLPKFQIGEIVPMTEGGVLVSVYRKAPSGNWNGNHLYFIRLAADGTEVWRVDYRICADDAPGCGNWRLNDARIAPTADDGFIVLLGTKRIDRYDSRGAFLESQSVSRCLFQSYDAVAARDDTFYFAGRCELWNDNTEGGALVRWKPGCDSCWRNCHGCWRIRLPLRADDLRQSGYGLDLDFLADGNLLWTIYGFPGMNLDPGGRWQVRVTPSGQILPPGPLETSLQSDRGQWLLFSSALLPDARLIRLGRYQRGSHDGRIRLEFWDGMGSQRLGWRILDFGQDAGFGYNLGISYPEFRYLDARGSHAFYLVSHNDASMAIAGLDANGNVDWQVTLPINGPFAVGDGTSPRIYVATHVDAKPERRTAPAIYITSVE